MPAHICVLAAVFNRHPLRKSINSMKNLFGAHKIDKYIEIVGSNNPRINALVRGSQLTIRATLSKRYTKVGITMVDDMAGLKRLVAKKPDLVVLGMKLILLDPSKSYNDSPKLWLSSYLKKNGINFTGSDAEAVSLEFDKQLAKQKVIDAGLQTTPYFISRVNQRVPKHTLRFPLFVKPSNSADSRGIDEKSVVYSEEELKAKISTVHSDFGFDVLVEEYLPGREFSVAVVARARSNNLIAMPIEISIPADKKGNSFLSQAVKAADSEKVLAVDDPKLKSAINALAIGVFKALGARDYGRIDMRLDSQGNPSFIEANLVPGLSDRGYLSRCFYLNDQIAYEDMILSIVNLAFKRVVSLPIKKPTTVLRPGLDELDATPLAGVGLVV